MSRDPERRTIPRPPDAVLFEMDGVLVASLEAAGIGVFLTSAGSVQEVVRAAGSVLANTNRTAR